MLNPVKLHDGLWSIGLASVFNWSPTSGSVRPCESGSNGESGRVKVSHSVGGVHKELSRKGQNFDPTALYHHFPFASSCNFNILSGSDNCKESLVMKNAGGKSFTIDSLLGINAAQVAIQNRLHPGNRPTPTTCRGEGDSDNNWTLDKHQQLEQGGRRENRNFHSRKERDNSFTRSNLGTEKSGEKLSKNSRRLTKSKRVRTIFTPEQLERLEAEFERQQYMVGPERLYLASTLYLTEAQVKVWFQNRRIKWRKQHLEMQQQRLAIFRSQSSHLDPRGEDDDAYENDSEDDDGSKSSTPPPHPPPPPCPTDFSPSNSTTAGFPTIGCGTLQLSSFTGNVTQMLGEGEGPTSMFPECSTSPRNYSRRVTQESNNSTGFDHVGGCDSSYLAHSPSFE